MTHKRGHSSPLVTCGSEKCHYTLKQLKELITDIYIQKVKHDDKCVNQNHSQRETMEQYLYTYLNQKYGLKNIVIDQVNGIISGIANYQRQDHDVLLFGKVLKNEIDEEFRYVQHTIKSTTIQMLKTFVKEKHPNKSTAAIEKVMLDLQSDKVQVEYSIWNKIINHMYEAKDVEILHKNLRANAQELLNPADSKVDDKRRSRLFEN